MSTKHKSILLTTEQDKWINRQIQKGSFKNYSEYIRKLVREDQNRNDKLTKLKIAIEKGLESGVSTHSIPDIMNTVEESLRKDGKL